MKTQTKTPHTKITHNNRTMVKTKTTQPTTITMLAAKIMESEATTVEETMEAIMEVIKDLDTGLEITNALQSVNTSAFYQKQKDHKIKKRSKKKQITSYTSFRKK
ncbi:Hypothetical_protein [Hexamita inflata]|nr:Hypothetical protein HINF_LOCUS7789 [Hexamita inflata]